jgi:SAM-dependent methyltransferase
MISLITRNLKRLKDLPAGTATRLVVLNIRYVAFALIDRAADFLYGVRTGTSMRGRDPLESLTLTGDANDAIAYAPTPYSTLRRMFRALPVSPSECAFIDFGSGRGRTLVLASKYGFKEIVGVEFARELHDDACRNIAASGARNARSVLCDARAFELPDIPCVLFFFNPFSGETLSKVAANVLMSFRRCPRRIVVALLNESSVAPFLEGGVFVLSATIDEGRLAQLSHSGHYVVRVLDSLKVH